MTHTTSRGSNHTHLPFDDPLLTKGSRKSMVHGREYWLYKGKRKFGNLTIRASRGSTSKQDSKPSTVGVGGGPAHPALCTHRSPCCPRKQAGLELQAKALGGMKLPGMESPGTVSCRL